jgi:hypothetical protein
MSDDPNTDWIAPQPISASDELTTVETRYGPMEKWKARALSVGWFQRVANSVRDDAATNTPVPEEANPPPLAADVNRGSDHPTRDDEQQPRAQIDPPLLDALETKIADLAARMDRFEAAQHAAAVLDALEAQIEQEHPPTPDDAAGLTMH